LSGNLIRLLLQLSEGEEPALLTGSAAKPFFGPAFQDLLRRRILVELAPASEWQTCEACECGLNARPIVARGDSFVAPCPLDSTADAVLDREDLRLFQFEVGAFVSAVAAASDFHTAPFEASRGVWQLGEAAGRMIFLVPGREPTRETSLVTVLRSLAKQAPVSIVAPSLPLSEQQRFSDAEMHLVAIAEAIGDDHNAFKLPLDSLHPDMHVPIRLTIDDAARSATVDGCLVRLTPRSFKVLSLLAEAALNVRQATRRQIEWHLWGNALVNKGAAADAIRGLRHQLRRGGLREDIVADLIRTRATAGYWLNLKPEEIEIITTS
jgi:DNA-binding winged helix-turn-helix (wHTH) protein